jgi:PKD repeat protein
MATKKIVKQSTPRITIRTGGEQGSSSSGNTPAYLALGGAIGYALYSIWKKKTAGSGWTLLATYPSFTVNSTTSSGGWTLLVEAPIFTVNSATTSGTWIKLADSSVSVMVSTTSGSWRILKTSGITVNATPVYPIASFSMSVDEGIAPLWINFVDLSSGTITGWQWSFGDGSSSNERNPLHQYMNAGTYTVILTVTGPSGSSYMARSLIVRPAQSNTPNWPAPGTVGDGQIWYWVVFTDGSTGWYKSSVFVYIDPSSISRYFGPYSSGYTG